MTATVRKLLSLATILLSASSAACAPPPSVGLLPPVPAPTPAADPSAPVASDASGEPSAKVATSDSTSWPFGPAPSPAELQAQSERLGKDPGPIKSNWTPPGKSDRYGHAEGLIAAPYDAVKDRLLDFPRYRELAGPKFKKVGIVDKSAGGTDLYFQLPIMKGLVTLWYVTRFASARPAMGGAEVVEGKFVKGNIKDMQIVFSIRPAPDDRTIFVCDLNLAIKIPAPQSALDEELRDACGDAVNAVRAHVAQPQQPAR